MTSNFVRKKAQVQIISMILLTGISIAAVSGALWWGLPMLDKSKTNSEVTQAFSIMQNIKTSIDEVSSSGGSRVINLNLAGEMRIDGGTLNKTADGSIKAMVPSNRINSITYTIMTKGVTSAVGQWVSLDGFNPISQPMYTGNNTDSVMLPGNNECNFSLLCTINDVDVDCTDNTMDYTGAVSGTHLGTDGYKVEYIDCINDFVTISGPEKVNTGFSGVNEAGVIVVKTIPHGDGYKTIFKLVYRELDDINNENGNGYLTLITKKGNNIIGSSDSLTKVSLTISTLDDFVSGVVAEKTGGPLTVTPVTVSFGS
ncbi:MAG: hypothetical protein GQ477_02010 [Nanohaloarchaea archaeon]|nr:hypothetical protein [Candidatus Nanohaloarchaea archaeon]